IRDFHVTGVQTCALPILTATVALRFLRVLRGVTASCPSGTRGRTLTGRKLPPGRGGTLLPSGGIGRRRRLSSSCLKGVRIGPFPPTALTILALRSLTSQSRLSGSMRALLLWPRLSI